MGDYPTQSKDNEKSRKEKQGHLVHPGQSSQPRRQPRFQFAQRLQPLVAALLVALLTLTCSLGERATQDPLFIAPNGEVSLKPATPLPSEDPPPTESDPTAIPSLFPENTPTPTPTQPPAKLLYNVQSGDTLPVLAIRFGVAPDEITSPNPIPTEGFISPDQLLIIPNRLVNTTSPQRLLPDTEIIDGPSTIDFDIQEYVKQAGGYLANYTEYMKTTGTTSGADVIARVALENSINPRLLLALLEYQSGWVFGQPSNLAQVDYPMGKIDYSKKGLFAQLVWAVNQLSIGYYGWREGHLTQITFPDGVTARLAPQLNAGTVALQYYFAQIDDSNRWVQDLDLNQGLPAVHTRMFGDPWVRAIGVEPLFPPDIVQPLMILPFRLGQRWAFTGGPHGAWEHDGAYAALDFAPGSTESGCVPSDAWVVASAAGKVVRSGNGVVVLDMDGDGHEQTGWVMVYLHVSSNGRVKDGTWMETGDLLGHPSCEGGVATGTHVHLARKYNGEWIAADGPLPFNLNGWIAHAGDQPYIGTLTRGNETVTASVYGTYESTLVRTEQDPAQ